MVSIVILSCVLLMFYLVDKLAEFPVGTILSWVMKIENNGSEFVDLPSGWVRCDGETIPHNDDGESIWAGKKTVLNEPLTSCKTCPQTVQKLDLSSTP